MPSTLNGIRKNHLAPIVIIGWILVGCQKKEAPTEPSSPDSNPKDHFIEILETPPRFVTDTKSFRFEGAVRTIEPVSYPYLWVEHFEDYQDSTRVVAMLQNEFKTITQYSAINFFAGKATQSFHHGTMPNNESNSMTFKFYHPSFLMTSLNSKTGNYNETGVVFGIPTQRNVGISWAKKYPWVFMDNYIVRFISGISLWPYLTLNDADSPQFVATAEASEPKGFVHYHIEGLPNFPYDIKSNLYTGFYTSGFAGNYVGIAKGAINLDTAFISKWNTDIQIQANCSAYLDRRGDTLFLGVLFNTPPSSEVTASLYQLIEPENVLRPIYRDIAFPYAVTLFRAGEYYVHQNNQYSIFSIQGDLRPLELPTAKNGISFGFTRNKIVGIAYAEDLKSLEIYSRNY